MADVRLPSSLSPTAPARPQSPARVEALRNAQRAFFQAALNGEAQPAPAAEIPRVATPAQAAPVGLGTAISPDRPLRPGSLVDIKV